MHIRRDSCTQMSSWVTVENVIERIFPGAFGSAVSLESQAASMYSLKAIATV